MFKKIHIKFMYGNKFEVEKEIIKNSDPAKEFYHLIFDLKEYALTKEELRQFQNFLNNFKID